MVNLVFEFLGSAAVLKQEKQVSVKKSKHRGETGTFNRYFGTKFAQVGGCYMCIRAYQELLLTLVHMESNPDSTVK